MHLLRTRLISTSVHKALDFPFVVLPRGAGRSRGSAYIQRKPSPLSNLVDGVSRATLAASAIL
jgi:hypothetical protein